MVWTEGGVADSANVTICSFEFSASPLNGMDIH